MTVLTHLQLFLICWFSFIIGIGVGLAWFWLWTGMTDAELRQEHHTESEMWKHRTRQDEHEGMNQ